MVNFNFAKKLIIALLLFAFLFGNTVPVKATGAEIAVLIIFAGKVYSYSSMAISAVTAAASAKVTKDISEETEQTITDFIEKIGERVEAADREAHLAQTEQEVKSAMEKAAALRLAQTKYINYLNALRQNKAVVFKEILIGEAKSQAAGYIRGKIKSYILDDDVLDAGTSIGLGLYESGKKLIEGQTSAVITEADKAFVKALKGGKATAISAAITKAEWDKFVNTVAKEEFKDYLTGGNETFKNLPLAIQEKYRQKLFLLTSDELDEIHNIMQQARETGDYFSALKQIIEKHPYYKDTFINLGKGLLGNDQAWIKKLEQALRSKLETQEKELKKLKSLAKQRGKEEQKKEQKAEKEIKENKEIIHVSGEILDGEPFEYTSGIWEKRTVIDGKIDIWIDMRNPHEHEPSQGLYPSYPAYNYPAYAETSGWYFLEFQCTQEEAGFSTSPDSICTEGNPGCVGWAKVPFSTEKKCYRVGEWYPSTFYKPQNLSTKLRGSVDIPMEKIKESWIKETYPSAIGYVSITDLVWHPEESNKFWIISQAGGAGGINAAIFSDYSIKGHFDNVHKFSTGPGKAGTLPDWASKY